MNTYDYTGRVAVVTGGCNGIGAAVTQRLVESGARVAVWDMDTTSVEPAISQLPESSVRLIPVDVSNLENVEAARASTEQAFGGVDILVNSAGIAGPTSTLADYDAQMWRKVQSVNLDGTFHTCKALTPLMRFLTEAVGLPFRGT